MQACYISRNYGLLTLFICWSSPNCSFQTMPYPVLTRYLGYTDKCMRCYSMQLNVKLCCCSNDSEVIFIIIGLLMGLYLNTNFNHMNWTHRGNSTMHNEDGNRRARKNSTPADKKWDVPLLFIHIWFLLDILSVKISRFMATHWHTLYFNNNVLSLKLV